MEKYSSAKAEHLLENSKAQTAGWKKICTGRDRESKWDSNCGAADGQEDLPHIVGRDVANVSL